MWSLGWLGRPCWSRWSGEAWVDGGCSAGLGGRGWCSVGLGCADLRGIGGRGWSSAGWGARLVLGGFVGARVRLQMSLGGAGIDRLRFFGVDWCCLGFGVRCADDGLGPERCGSCFRLAAAEKQEVFVTWFSCTARARRVRHPFALAFDAVYDRVRVALGLPATLLRNGPVKSLGGQ